MVDWKQPDHFLSKIKAEKLISLLTKMVFQQRKHTDRPGKHFVKTHANEVVICKDQSITLSDHFQSILRVRIFGAEVTIVFNDLLCVAMFSKTSDF